MIIVALSMPDQRFLASPHTRSAELVGGVSPSAVLPEAFRQQEAHIQSASGMVFPPFPARTTCVHLVKKKVCRDSQSVFAEPETLF